MSEVWFITGAGRGFGRAFAEEAVKRGHLVIAGLRHIPEDDAFFKNKDVLPVRMDVTKPEEVKAAVQEGIKFFGRIDVLVNNAGFGMTGAFEETSDEDLRKLFETDYFGVVNVTREVLPIMRKQQSGKIFNVSSQGGVMGFAGSSAYCAAKFAVVGLSEVLRQELAPFHIDVAAVCPGSFRTDFRKANSMHDVSLKIDAYNDTAVRKAGDFLHVNRSNQSGDPKKAAVFLCDMAAKDTLPSRIYIGERCCREVKDMLYGQIKDIESYEEASSKTDF
ncbi:MAG: SDR family oxidoreductase [Acidaminococcus sp.]|jgi:NAD(P)-dependent dehydrogenase (short-subunit alcohol dehydrogenase family)|nr:SDR family oxidoreductase [Acidaminococcus sp.]